MKNEDLEAASLRSASQAKIGSHIPDRWPYWLAKVADDPAWRRVTIGGLVKLAQETSLDAVSTALGYAMEGRDNIGNPMGWLRVTAHLIVKDPDRTDEWRAV